LMLKTALYVLMVKWIHRRLKKRKTTGMASFFFISGFVTPDAN
jgi:hypothetical protein